MIIWFYEQYEACKNGKSDRFKVWHISSEDVVYNRAISDSWTQKHKEEVIRYLEEEKKSKKKKKTARKGKGKK